MSSIVSDLSRAMDENDIHKKHNGYTGNCANVAVALYEIALEDYGDDFFRFVVVDRPSHFGSGPDHIALEYSGKYLDSKGIHSERELLDIIGEDGNEAMLQVESKSYVVNNVHYYKESRKDEVKSMIRSSL